MPNLSKIFERCILNKCLSFLKVHFLISNVIFTQQCLLVLFEKWKRSVDRDKGFGVLPTDLSKAFDCLDHELLMAKRNAYGFGLPALRLIHDYLPNRKRRTKINCSYSEWLEIVFRVPQGFILRPILFNNFFCGSFLYNGWYRYSKLCKLKLSKCYCRRHRWSYGFFRKCFNSLLKSFNGNDFQGNANKCHSHALYINAIRTHHT